jgi:hypothetical protein
MDDLVVKNSSELELKMKKGGLGPPASFFKYSAFILEPEQPSRPMRDIHIDRRRPQA